AAAAILGGWVTITNARARVEPGGQGDARFFELIEDMGCGVQRRGDSVTVRREGALHGIVANVMDCSDTFPTLAVIATQADTTTELTGIAHTRAQESDGGVAPARHVRGSRSAPRRLRRRSRGPARRGSPERARARRARSEHWRPASRCRDPARSGRAACYQRSRGR